MINIEIRLHAVLDLMEGRVTAPELASRFGVSEQEIETWRAAYLAGARGAVAAPRRAFRVLGVAIAAVASLGLIFGSSRVLAQAGCAQTLPSPLTTFCANAPAMANQVNGNFQATVNFLQQKVGPVGTNVVTMNGRATVDGGITVIGNANITGPDLVLSNPGRGTTSGRALVHDNGNILTVNYQNDFTGGVSIQSNATVTGNLVVSGNTWGAESSGTEIRFSETGATLTYTNCPQGQFVCGVGVGHQVNDSQYWTGARLNVRCCAL